LTIVILELINNNKFHLINIDKMYQNVFNDKILLLKINNNGETLKNIFIINLDLINKKYENIDIQNVF